MILLSTMQQLRPTDLKIGTVLQSQGYGDNHYVITGKTSSDFGSHYAGICIRTKEKRTFETNHLQHISAKKDSRIATYYTNEFYTPAMVDMLKVEAERVEIEQEKAKDKAKEESAKRIEQYKKDFSYLKPVADGGTVTGNIKKELQLKFKGVKFSVSKNDYNSIGIRWTDGPKIKEVEDVTGKYEAGHFDGMDDIYNYTHSDWHIFGYAKYINHNRSISKEVESGLLKKLKKAAEKLKLESENSLIPIEGTAISLGNYSGSLGLWGDSFISDAYNIEYLVHALAEVI